MRTDARLSMGEAQNTSSTAITSAEPIPHLGSNYGAKVSANDIPFGSYTNTSLRLYRPLHSHLYIGYIAGKKELDIVHDLI